jgi:hypothetical protein
LSNGSGLRGTNGGGTFSVDYRATPDIVLGGFGRWGELDATARDSSFSIKGENYLAGGQLAVRFLPNWVFNGYAGGLWSSYRNVTVTPPGGNTVATGSYDSTGGFYAAGLTGLYQLQWAVPLRLMPNITVSYLRESPDTFADSLGNTENAGVGKLGRLSFGARAIVPLSAGYWPMSFTGSLFGEYDFTRTQAVSVVDPGFLPSRFGLTVTAGLQFSDALRNFRLEGFARRITSDGAESLGGMGTLAFRF